MTFTINQAALLSALNIAGRAVGTNNVIPALSNYLFDFTKDTLSVTGSNMEVFITTTTDVSSKFKGSIMVPAQRIAGLVKELPGGDLKCELEIKKTEKSEFYNLTIKSGKGKYVIPCEFGEHFPVMDCKPELEFKIDSDTLIDGIKKTIFATDKTGTNTKLSGVLFSFENGKVTFAGCDGWVLSTNTYDIEAESNKRFTVPVKVLSMIMGLPSSDVIEIVINDRNIKFTLNESTIIKSVLVDEVYPDYTAIIPINNPSIVKVNREQLIGSLKRVGSFSNAFINSINLIITNEGLSIASNNDFEESALEEIECNLTGEPVNIWVKGDQVLPLIQRMDGDSVYMHLSTPNRAIVFKSDENAPDDKKDLMLAMPVNL